MKLRVPVVIAVGLFVFGCSGSKKEKSEIEGVWVVTSADKDTKLDKGPTKEQLSHSKFTFALDKFTMEFEERKNEGTFKVDPSKNPKEIDLTGGRGVMKGIYKVDGSDLTLCLGAPETSRPTQFSAAPGSGATLVVLKRQ